MPPLLPRVQRILADILQLPTDQITPTSSPETLPGWDSVQHLNLILALEEEFGTMFEPDEIDQMGSVEGILSVVERRMPPR